jgi:hypothetical protein
MNMNFHSFKMIAGLVLVFVVAGLQAIHGMTTFNSTIDVIMPALLFLEHMNGGNTSGGALV